METFKFCTMHSTVTAENIPIEPQLWRREEQEGSDCVNMP